MLKCYCCLSWPVFFVCVGHVCAPDALPLGSAHATCTPLPSTFFCSLSVRSTQIVKRVFCCLLLCPGRGGRAVSARPCERILREREERKRLDPRPPPPTSAAAESAIAAHPPFAEGWGGGYLVAIAETKERQARKKKRGSGGVCGKWIGSGSVCVSALRGNEGASVQSGVNTHTNTRRTLRGARGARARRVRLCVRA